MGKHSPVAQAPGYLAQFRCVGSACPENCCTGWSVSIDKPSYQRYREVRSEPLAGTLRTHLVRSPQGDGKHYAEIRMQPDGACPFLDSQRLCSIQAQLGEQALSRTCSQYPRLYGQDAQAFQVHASLSCPEAARLALSDPAALDPVQITLPFANPEQVPVNTRRSAPAAPPADPVRQHAALIGAAVQSLVRLPQFTASQALVQAGLLVRRLARIEAQAAAGELALAQALEHYLSPQNLAEAPQLLERLPVAYAAQLSMLFESTQRYLSVHKARPSFMALIQDVGQGLAIEQGGEASITRLRAAHRDRWAPLEAAQPQLLKNYLLNDLGKSLFPTTDRSGLEREFMALAVRFGLIRLYVLGLAALRGEDFGIEDVVRVVYVVSRNMEHSRSFMSSVMDDLAAKGALRMDVLTTLVL